LLRLDRETLNDRAYASLRQSLMSGKFSPGEVLVIRKLAESLGISTTPIREALQRLVAERILEVKHNRSIAVPLLSLKAFSELVRIRCAVEGLATEIAASRLGRAQLVGIRETLAGMDEAIGVGNGEKYLVLNEQFHFAIYGCADAPILLNIIEDLWGRVGPYMHFLMEIDAYVPRSNACHRQIVSAIERHDAAGARSFVVEDIMVAAAALKPLLDQPGGDAE
jgi:DNA-binding GntR family transcriptional regulator